MDFEMEIERLRRRISPLSRFVHALANSLEAPKFLQTEMGFRFEKPQLIHFCLLRCARIVSALNASIELARYGYSQEIGVLLRTMIEYDSQIDFMMARLNDGGVLAHDAADFVSSFFADAHRPGSNENKKARLIQKKVHDVIGERLDKSRSNKTKSASDMLSNIYLIFSNYVHGKYPETMDLYGGGPGHFHLHGMSRTPKDLENLETINTLINSAALCFVGKRFSDPTALKA